jgi:D-alanine-D-alanine ligase
LSSAAQPTPSCRAECAPSSSAPAGAPATLTVAVLAGGRSSEHEVSLSSGAAIREGLLTAGHEVLAIEISRDGHWRHDGEPIAVRPAEGLLGADVAFAALHGPYGEDGAVQGALETLDLPYVGAGVAASALCMDKVLFKRLLSASHPPIPQVEHVAVPEPRWHAQPAAVLAEIERLGLPVFVKPAHLGSSVGIVKVADHTALTAALQQAFVHDELAIVEALAHGIEVECAVLGLPATEAEVAAAGRASGLALASTPGEISFPGEFYDYAAKYTPGGMELVIPARISADAHTRVQKLALRTFAEVACEGLARVDFFVDGDHVLVNELNTMPGFTPTSVYAKLLAATGVPYPELLDRLCRLAIERHHARATRTA